MMNGPFIDGGWVETNSREDVIHPYNGQVVETIGAASMNDVERALVAADRAAIQMEKMSLYERSKILERAAALLEADMSGLADAIVRESGKPINEARLEAARIPEIFRLCGEEARRIHGETVPLGAVADSVRRVGYTVRTPFGVVVAITPYNYPALLVAHKIGPAIAAGNAVILKPSPQAPVTALHLVDALARAGMPPGGIQCLTGSSASIGSALVADARTSAVSFTGSTAVGNTIAAAAGARRTLMEMGGNCAMVVARDADIELAAASATRGGFVNAGQVCISVQRVLVHETVAADFLAALTPMVQSLRIGDPFDDTTELSAVVSEAHSIRVHNTLLAAASAGGRIVIGGERSGSIVQPTIVANVSPSSELFVSELFGPAVAVTTYDEDDEAIRLVNATSYGLAAAIYTADLHRAMTFIDQARAGALHVNGGPLWRADAMPYGGLKGSGRGKEGPRYAIEDLTDLKMVSLHLGSN